MRGCAPFAISSKFLDTGNNQFTLKHTLGRELPGLFFEQMMRRLFTFFGSMFAARRNPASHRHLLGMYFGESNSPGRRKPNRDRA